MYLIFDTETTGLPKDEKAPLTDFDNWPRLVQIAWQLHDNKGKLLEAQNYIIKPEGFSIPYNAQKVHGISTQRALDEGKPLQDVLAIFSQTLENTKLIIGHNVEFDLNIVGAEYLRKEAPQPPEGENSTPSSPFGGRVGVGLAVLDTKLVATDFVAIPSGKGNRFKWPSLTELHLKLFGEKFEDAHDAAYDVAATTRCFFGLIQAKVVKPIDDTPLDEIRYEAPKLAEANFAKKEIKITNIQQNPSEEMLTPSPLGRVGEGLGGLFNHLHVHTQYSLLQSTIGIKYLMKKVKAEGMTAVAITDHGNMHAAFNAVAYGAEEGVKVILGCEVYISEDRKRKEFKEGKHDRRNLAVLLAKHKEGYANLSKLCSRGYTEGMYAGFPRVGKDIIQEYAEGLMALIGSFESEIYTLILNEGEEVAEKALLWWLEIFQDDLYLEICRHGLEAQDYVNSVLLKLAKKYKIKVVATNAVYYLHKSDADAHDTLLAVKDGKAKTDEKKFEYGLTDYVRGKRRFGFPNEEFYFKSQAEMQELFADLPEAINNIQEIVDKCETYKLKRDILMPKFELPAEFETQDDFLRHLAYEGAKKHFGEELSNEVIDRLELELNTIKNMGFPGYFLIVQDFINAAKKSGVFVGLGRGSAAGSLVAYCTGITNIDPIKYDLLFERFLNPERVSMPDIDIDFDDAGRQSVIDYVINKYGKNQVAQIITYGTMAAKMVIKDVARVMELDLAESNRITKLVPEKPGTKLKDAFADIPELRQIYEGKDERAKVLKDALILEGSVRGTGIHAAGVIIAPEDLLNCIPVCTAKDADLWVTQFDGKVIEEAGMLKMDFLGLKTLTVIKDALQIIKSRHGIDIDIDKIPLDDAKTFELYQKGNTIGTFQFESEGMQMYLNQLNPTNIEDLIAMNALYRPGPMQFIPLYIDRKHGREVLEYPHPILEPILSKTFGIMVYQEQIMQTAQIMAGYSLGGADLLRRAMGKKKKEDMDKQREIFVKGSKEKNDIPETKANEVFDIMAKFAEYGFNRSHSAAYSVLAYQTAYLKANYPAEYMASVLSHNMNIEKITFFLEECQKMGVAVLGPDVNESETGFSVNAEGKVRFGLAAIKGTGEAAVENIIAERKSKGKFKDVFDFARRLSLRVVNKKSFESLAQAGAYDSFKIDRAAYFGDHGDGIPFIEKLLKYGNAYQKDQESSQNSLFGASAQGQISTPPVPQNHTWTKLERLNKEKEVVGFYISGHPLDQFKNATRALNIRTLDQLEHFDRQEITVAGIVTSKVIKQGQRGSFTIVTIEDTRTSVEIPLFNQDHENFSDSLEKDDLVLIKGKVQKNYRGDKFEIKINSVQDLSELGEKFCSGVRLQIDLKKLNSELINQIEKLAKEFSGDLPLHLTVFDAEEKYHTELKSKKYQVQQNDLFMRKLEDLEINCSLIY